MPWSLPAERRALLGLALDYPYAAPGRSYLFEKGEARAPDGDAWAREAFAGRVPVLAHGSNRAPAQLRRKFGTTAVIPVIQGWLRGYDVVYAAQVARYGAVTSTLAAAPGVAVRVAITWLTPDQLAFMHQTERMNYGFGQLPAGIFDPEAGPPTEPLAAYVSNHGPLLLDGKPVALGAVEASGRRGAVLMQADLQRDLARRHHPGEDLEALLLARIADPGQRQAFERRLRGAEGTPPPALPGFTLLQRLDETLP